MEETLWGEAVRFMTIPVAIRFSGVHKWSEFRATQSLYALQRNLQRRWKPDPDETSCQHSSADEPARSRPSL